jgi:hypothetical protein
MNVARLGTFRNGEREEGTEWLSTYKQMESGCQVVGLNASFHISD